MCRAAVAAAVALLFAPVAAASAKGPPAASHPSAALSTFHASLYKPAGRRGDQRRACLTRLPRIQVAGSARAAGIVDKIVPVACELPPRWFPRLPPGLLHLNPLGALLGG